ncbi:hypothetical protein ELH73_22055 [Rhizobium leguminosarum]|nr:hypothetical protein ELI28_22075 [Rhizobium leguminosarum]TAV80658.1 hypothetical protein ELI27_22055 [Rhizobium leguminosarum]TAX36898.1 hypothetical protein ELI06_22410 [Rhizobium leguminosarum]TAZ32385.1 hypothetical protein ELH73_22055 [Rhizobium leguminosarum]
MSKGVARSVIPSVPSSCLRCGCLDQNLGRIKPSRKQNRPSLQRRASFQTRKGRCRTLNCCIILSLNRSRFRELCSRK